MAPSGPPVQKNAPAAAKEEKKPPKVKKEKKEEDKDEKPRLKQPDRAEFEASVEGVQHAIDKLQKQQHALTTKINERSGGKDEFFQQKAEIRTQLDEFSGKMNELQAKKDEILKGVGEKQQEGREMRQQLNKMKKSIGYVNEAEIDDRIQSIEFNLLTNSMPLKEEKKLLLEISELKRNRPKVGSLHQMEASIESHQAGASMKEKVSIINEEMAKYREGKRKVHEKLTELMEGRKTQLGDLPQIITERDDLSKQIQEKIKERGVLRDEFRASEREYNAYLNEERKIRQEKSMEERAKRQQEYDQRRLAREAEKLDDQPHVAEITLIEQSMAFCKSLTQTKDTDKKEDKKEIEHNNPEGTEVMVKKEDREEFYYLPTAKAKKGKQKKAGGKTNAIKHNAETFRLFDQLKLDAPITTDDIPAVLEKLEAQLESYKEKVKEWEEKREEMKRRILEGGVVEEKEEEKKEEEAEEKKEEADA